jgi:uncharacterized membrane protein
MTDFHRTIGRLLIAVTYIAAALLTVGFLLMLVTGISPLSGGPGLDLYALAGDLATLAPSAFLWIGLLAVMAIPICQVVAGAVGFGRVGDRQMVGIALAILFVIATSVAIALLTG